ncbi:MAG: putative rane protein [Gaiellaceae bacterium]|nr:putative rane protein [Gaiellaceae bacterium]
MRWRVVLWAAIGAFAAGFGALAVLRHLAFNTGRFDLGNMVQAVWSTAHGDLLSVTSLRGPQISRLGAHFDPILAAFAPLWWLWPDPSLLLVVQVVAVALGAVPVHLLARKHLGSERAGVGFALAYLLYPPTQWLALNEFHPVALATPLLLLAFWYLDEDRLLAFAAVAAVACLTKEHIGFAVAALGVWYALARGRRRAGAAIAVAGTAVAVLAITVVVPHFAPGGASPFAGRYREVGGSPAGILETVVTDPLRVLESAFDGNAVPYLLELVLPLAALPLLAPLAALTALPELAANLLSTTRTQQSIHFHYTAAAIPGLVVAAVFGASRLRRRGRPVVTGVVVVALAANYVLGAIPVWRAFPGGESLGTREHLVSAHDRVAARAVRLIPPDAAVTATNSLGAHLSERRRVHSFPFLHDSEWIAADETRPGYADRISALATSERLRRLRLDPDWRIVFDEDGITVFRRR